MNDIDLSDFLHAMAFYAVSVVFTGLAAILHTFPATFINLAATFASYYAVAFLAVIAFAAFVMGTISFYAGVLSLKGVSK